MPSNQKQQIRDNNDRLIRRLVEARVFPNKDVVIAAALQTLMAGLSEMAKDRHSDAKAELDSVNPTERPGSISPSGEGPSSPAV